MSKKIEEISFCDFNEKYMQPSEKWDFNKFKIRCTKCNSENVEYAGQMEVEHGYYGWVGVINKIIIKCHDCGNAHAIKTEGGGENSFCPDPELYE